ncbi:MAG: GNAT family N-acetyltransferase [Thermoplasmata archaeon]
MEFRELRRADLPSFEKVILQGYGRFEAVTGIGDSATEQLRSLRNIGIWSLLRLLQALRIANVRLLVAVEHDQVVGTAVLASFSNAVYVGGVATDAAARGRGIASGVMELARAKAHARGKPWLALDVESENETALRVYRRIGYTEVARWDWFVGPPPPSILPAATVATEVPLKDRKTADWVNQTLPPAIRDPLPANARAVTHLEFFARPSKGRFKMWNLTSGDRVIGVVRGCFGPKIRVGFVLPVGVDPSLPLATLQALVAPAIEWHRSLGATRIALAVREPVGGWSAVAASLGLPLGVTTTLMVRPSAPGSNPAPPAPRPS